MGVKPKYSEGVINSMTGIRDDPTFFQISVPIQPGNSGGPLFDKNLNLIGITSSGFRRDLDLTENVNYAIKSSFLKNLVNVLEIKLKLPKNKNFSRYERKDQLKEIKPYVVFIKVKK